MITRRTIVLIALLIALLALTAVASAKTVPYVEPLDSDWGGLEDPFVPPSGAFFANFFGRLDADDVDAVRMTFKAPAQDILVELLVPECGDELGTFHPSLALIGPGLDVPDPDVLTGMPFELDKGLGLVLLADGGATDAAASRVAEVSLFGWNFYGQTLDLPVDIPQAGDYVFVVWNPEQTVGAYALTAGGGHPDQVQFPDERTMRETTRLLDSGEWIGLDCGATGAAK